MELSWSPFMTSICSDATPVRDHRGVDARGPRGVRDAAGGARRYDEVHLSKSGNEVLVQGQIDVQLAIPCARCLGRVELRPHAELSLLLTESVASAAATASGRRGARRARSKETSEASDAEDGFASEEADLDTYEGEEVVLDRFVREAILLESPIFPLCSEACEGIRPASDTESPSSETPTDPRLLPLLELAKRRRYEGVVPWRFPSDEKAVLSATCAAPIMTR